MKVNNLTKKIITCLTLLFFSFGLFVFYLNPIFAQSNNDEFEKKLQEKQKEILDLQTKLQETQKQAKTLKSELEKLDGQIKLSELKIEEAKFQITKLEKEITDLNGRIDRLSGTVDRMSEVLLNRIVSTYKYNNYSTVDLLFSARGFTDLLERVKYLQVIQANDKKVLYQLQATKDTYNDQKNDRENRQNQQVAAQRQLEALQQKLETQRKARDELLKITQNDERNYQERLKKAQIEQDAILAIFSGGGKETVVGPVSKGDNIGSQIIGASPCSTGTHLHFQVQKDGFQNPANFLSNKSVTFDNSPDGTFSFSGSWDQWPISDPIKINQGFGSTYWAQQGWYKNPPGHTGIDMSSSSLTVKAVLDGKLSRGSIKCGGGNIYYKKIEHSDGITTYYLHMI